MISLITGHNMLQYLPLQIMISCFLPCLKAPVMLLHVSTNNVDTLIMQLIFDIRFTIEFFFENAPSRLCSLCTTSKCSVYFQKLKCKQKQSRNCNNQYKLVLTLLDIDFLVIVAAKHVPSRLCSPCTIFGMLYLCLISYSINLIQANMFLQQPFNQSLACASMSLIPSN